MRKFALLVVTLLAFSGFAFAQSDTPAGEVYGGYQYTLIDTHAVQDALNLAHVLSPTTIPLIDFGTRQGQSGWNFGIQENTNSWFGAIVDGSGNYGVKRIQLLSSGGITVETRTRLQSYTLLAGPQFTSRRFSHFQPFGRALFGGAWFDDSTNILANNVPLIAEIKENVGGFGMGGGGGTDVSISSHLGVRVAVDYIRTFFFDDSQNNFRGTIALVYRFGQR